MSGVEWAGLITAATAGLATVLTLFGKATQYIVSLVLEAYKHQADATVAAKDQDLASKDEINRVLRDETLAVLHEIRESLKGLHAAKVDQ